MPPLSDNARMLISTAYPFLLSAICFYLVKLVHRVGIGDGTAAVMAAIVGTVLLVVGVVRVLVYWFGVAIPFITVKGDDQGNEDRRS